jgi:hypothetical protein
MDRACTRCRCTSQGDRAIAAIDGGVGGNGDMGEERSDASATPPSPVPLSSGDEVPHTDTGASMSVEPVGEGSPGSLHGAHVERMESEGSGAPSSSAGGGEPPPDAEAVAITAPGVDAGAAAEAKAPEAGEPDAEERAFSGARTSASGRVWYYFWPKKKRALPRPAFLEYYPPEEASAIGIKPNILSFLGRTDTHGGDLYVPQ